MTAQRGVLSVAMVLAFGTVTDAARVRCRVCGFGAAQASEARCLPDAGLVVVNSLPPGSPVYWVLGVNGRRGRSRGAIQGRVREWADYTVGVPALPGMPPTCAAADGVCFGPESGLRGRISGGRLRAVARYPGGVRCVLSAKLDVGVGGDPPNEYVCRQPSGEVAARGPLQVQVLRLLRCRR